MPEQVLIGGIPLYSLEFWHATCMVLYKLQACKPRTLSLFVSYHTSISMKAFIHRISLQSISLKSRHRRLTDTVKRHVGYYCYNGSLAAIITLMTLHSMKCSCHIVKITRLSHEFSLQSVYVIEEFGGKAGWILIYSGVCLLIYIRFTADKGLFRFGHVLSLYLS